MFFRNALFGIALVLALAIAGPQNARAQCFYDVNNDTGHHLDNVELVFCGGAIISLGSIPPFAHITFPIPCGQVCEVVVTALGTSWTFGVFPTPYTGPAPPITSLVHAFDWHITFH